MCGILVDKYYIDYLAFEHSVIQAVQMTVLLEYFVQSLHSIRVIK